MLSSLATRPHCGHDRLRPTQGCTPTCSWRAFPEAAGGHRRGTSGGHSRSSTRQRPRRRRHSGHAGGSRSRGSSHSSARRGKAGITFATQLACQDQDRASHTPGNPFGSRTDHLTDRGPSQSTGVASLGTSQQGSHAGVRRIEAHSSSDCNRSCGTRPTGPVHCCSQSAGAGGWQLGGARSCFRRL